MITSDRGLHDFDNFLFAKFCHFSVNAILDNDTDNCGDNADHGGVKNIVCGYICGERKIGYATYGNDVYAGSIEDKTQCNDKKRKNNHLSKTLPFVCVHIDDHPDRCNQTCNNKPFDRAVDKCHQVQHESQATVSRVEFQHVNKTYGKSDDNEQDSGRIRDKGKSSPGERYTEGIHNAVHDLVKPESLVKQVSPDYPHDNDCRNTGVIEQVCRGIENHCKPEGEKNHAGNLRIVKEFFQDIIGAFQIGHLVDNDS